MNPVQQRSRTPSSQPEIDDRLARSTATLPTWRLNVMRVGYFVMGVGLAVTKWPELIAHGPWELKAGTVLTMLVAMSVLALLGLRYPQRMLPILLFEAGWKVIWFGVVALPHLIANDLNAAAGDVLFSCSFVVVILAVIPWRYTWQRYVRTPGDAWR